MDEMHGAVGDDLNLPATIKTEIVILADDWSKLQYKELNDNRAVTLS